MKLKKSFIISAALLPALSFASVPAPKPLHDFHDLVIINKTNQDMVLQQAGSAVSTTIPPQNTLTLDINLHQTYALTVNGVIYGFSTNYDQIALDEPAGIQTPITYYYTDIPFSSSSSENYIYHISAQGEFKKVYADGNLVNCTTQGRCVFKSKVSAEGQSYDARDFLMVFGDQRGASSI